MKNFKILPILFFLCFAVYTSAQVKFLNLGASIGAGNLKGNSPQIQSLNFKLFTDIKPDFTDAFVFRLGYNYARKVEYFFPENRAGKYYPFIQSFSISAVTSNYFNKILFAEVGAGLLILNDRTFNDTDLWLLGAGFSIMGGIDLRKDEKGFQIGLLIDYGGVYVSTNAQYYSTSVTGKWFFR